MSILIVEDSPVRTRMFRQGFIGCCVTSLTTAPMAISWLESHTPHLLCLDYDLDQYGETSDRAGNGADVAQYIAKHTKRFEHTLIIVHSLNPKGAQRILTLLKKQNLGVSVHPNLWEEAATLDRLARVVQDMEKSPGQRITNIINSMGVPTQARNFRITQTKM